MASEEENQVAVVHQDPNEGALVELPEDLAGAIVENQHQIKHLQLEATRKELAVQRAVDEQKLLQELETLDQMTLHKIQRGDPNRPNRMMISDESLDRIVALQNAIKIASKEQQALDEESQRIHNDFDTVENAITEADQQLELSIENTGYTGQGGRPYEALDNVYRRHQLELAELEKEQKTIKLTMGKLTDQIEELTAQLEAVKTVEDDLADADGHIADITREHDGNRDTLASLHRILAKKEKVLSDIDRKDLMKDLKKLEGDKRVHHSDLSKQVELIRINERAILANDERIRKLDARLLELEKVLPGIFAAEDDEGLSMGKPPEVPETEEVSVGLFTDAIADLQEQRDTLAARDQRLEELDAAVEALERKIDIMHAAQESQTLKAANEIQEIDRERARLEQHVDQIAREFSAERNRLLSSRKALKM